MPSIVINHSLPPSQRVEWFWAVSGFLRSIYDVFFWQVLYIFAYSFDYSRKHFVSVAYFFYIGDANQRSCVNIYQCAIRNRTPFLFEQKHIIRMLRLCFEKFGIKIEELVSVVFFSLCQHPETACSSIRTGVSYSLKAPPFLSARTAVEAGQHMHTSFPADSTAFSHIPASQKSMQE